jgi:hypothetical protein
MLIVAEFTIAKIWNQPRCPSMDEWIRKMWHIYNGVNYVNNTMEYYSAVKKNEILSFTGTPDHYVK